MYFSIHTKKESITWKTEKIEKCIDIVLRKEVC